MRRQIRHKAPWCHGFMQVRSMILLRTFLATSSLLLLFGSGNAWSFPVPLTPEGQITLVEYVNDVTGHFVLLSDSTEIAAVDAGGFGPWRPTGYQMKAWSTTVAPSGENP